MLWTNWRADRGRLAATLAGVAAILAAAGVLDTLTLGYPFASVWRYVLYNVFYGVSSTFGVEPWPYYLLGELGVWGGAGATMLLLTAIGAWRLPLLLVVAIVILAVHSGIAHKEYRFIYPAIVPLTVLAGVGLAQMASWGREWLIGRGMPVDRSSRHQRRFGRGLVGRWRRCRCGTAPPLPLTVSGCTTVWSPRPLSRMGRRRAGSAFTGSTAKIGEFTADIPISTGRRRCTGRRTKPR